MLEATGVDRSVPASRVHSDEIGATTRINKEVDELKRIVFLIIGTLLVLGLVLPGCGGPGGGFENWITIGVIGPMANIQGRDHWAGALMAQDEINDAGGVTIGETVYGIALEKIDSNEIVDTTGVTGQTRLQAKIDSLDFVVGGFRTEAVIVYREVAMEAGVIFIDDGAATAALQFSVFADYPAYKYWFKGTPYNEVYLVTSCLKMTGGALAQIKAGLGNPPTPLKIEVLAEDAAWSLPMVPYVQGWCIGYGYNYTGLTKVASNANDISAQLQAIAADDPQIVFTILSGPPGKAYGAQQATYLPNVFSIGINVESQDIDYHADTGAKYHITLDTWAEDVALTSKTLTFFEDFVSTYGRYPTYCAATYDTIKALVEAVLDVGIVTDDVITWFEDVANAYTGTASTTGYYTDVTTFNATLGYLSFDQAMVLYPHLPAFFGTSEPELEAYWLTYALGINGSGKAGFTTSHGFLPHDTVYGPGWQTGQGVQWQPDDPAHPELAWSKVGWWPCVLLPGVGENEPAVDLDPTEVATLKAAGLLDKFGNWNFGYTGSVPLVIPADFITYWNAHGY